MEKLILLIQYLLLYIETSRMTSSTFVSALSTKIADFFDNWTIKLFQIRTGTYKLNLPEKQYGETFNETASNILYQYCKSKWFWCPTMIRLLEIGADPNYVATYDYSNTPLHLMARKGRWLAFLYLVQAGANVNAVNTLMQNSLMLACDSTIAGPRLRIIDIILKQPGAILDARDAGGMRQLSIYFSLFFSHSYHINLTSAPISFHHMPTC